jgi:Flp pilus assembly protein TadG
MMLSTRKERKSTRRRQAAVILEFALLAPVVSWLIIGMLEMSRGMMVKVTLNNAARKGCRTGVYQGKCNADITTDIKDIMSDNGYNATKFNPNTIGSITITVTDPSGNSVTDVLTAPSGSKILVTVAIPVSSTMWVTSFFLPKTTIQSETVVMMKQ